jgi:predicted ArsR family transcriptional regulator
MTSVNMEPVDVFDALGNVVLRTTLAFVRAQPGPVTAAEVAAALGVARTVARWRLERLAAARLVRTTVERRMTRKGPGSGRPAKVYAAAIETAQIEYPRRWYETIVGELIAALPTGQAAALLRDIGIVYGEELARAADLKRGRSLVGAVRGLCRGLGALGFQASVVSASATEAEVQSATCPLRPLVVAAPDARPIDEGMWRGLVAAVFAHDHAQIVCRTHDCFDDQKPCRIEIELT